MLKLIDNPPVLAPDVESLGDLEGTWWVAYTKSRFEKSFAWDLNSHGIGYFLPMYEYADNHRRSGMKLLFPSYVFFCGSDEDRYTALKTRRLFQVIDVPDQSGLISQLTAIEKRFRAEPFSMFIQMPRLARSRITSGPMVGTEGVVVETNDQKARMVLEVTVLGQGTAIEIDTDLLKPIA